MNKYLVVYTAFIKKILKLPAPLRVVADCSNGTVGLVLAAIKHPRLQFILLNQKVDGNFPAHGPDPMAAGAMEDLRRAVKKHKADVGVIFDADGDRVFFVDDRGRTMSSDSVALAISKNFSGPIILDLRAGYVAREGIAADRKKIIESRVGHYFIKKLMKEKKSFFAGEASGHYYFHLLSGYFDSGLVAAFYFFNQVAALKKKKSTLGGWLDRLPKYYHSGEINFKTRQKTAAMITVEDFYKKDRKNIISHLDGVKITGPNYWFSLRPSNTEDLLRLNLEAKDKKTFQQIFKDLQKLI